MNGLRSHTKNSKECFIRSPNTSKSVKKTRLRLVFSTHFSGFGYPDETLFLVFDILQEGRNEYPFLHVINQLSNPLSIQKKGKFSVQPTGLNELSHEAHQGQRKTPVSVV